MRSLLRPTALALAALVVFGGCDATTTGGGFALDPIDLTYDFTFTGAALSSGQAEIASPDIEDVAAATGVAKATLYYYFTGKEEILAFLLQDTLAHIADEVAIAVQQPDMRIGFLHDLAFHLEHETQHSVRSGMLRAEVHRVAADLSHFSGRP